MKTGIFILSYRRGSRLLRTKGTLNFVSDTWKDRTHIVVREEEIDSYIDAANRFNVNISVLPSSYSSSDPLFDWAQTMDFILEEIGIKENYDSIMLVDDDLVIAYRPDLTTSKGEGVTQVQFDLMMDNLMNRSNDIPIAGIIPRGFSHAFTSPEVHNKTIAGLTCLHVPFFKDNSQYRYFNEKVRHMGDRYMCLNTLTHGIQNVAFANFTHDSIINTEGGCSVRRTNQNHSESALNMARMFPDLVKLKVKTNLGDTRLDLHIDWLKAYKEKSDV